MYKIFINSVPLYLTNKADAETLAQQKGNNLLARYVGKPKILLSYADMLEKGSDFDTVIIYSADVEQLFRDFTNHYEIIEAAGGLVFNENDELLMIFRRGYWDLPKGKAEKGEGIEETAVREVEEETGIQNIELGQFFQKTYHFYRTKSNKRALKLSHWYIMKAPKQTLIPQTEEDIDKAIWIKIEDFEQQKDPIYGNIMDLIQQFQAEHRNS